MNPSGSNAPQVVRTSEGERGQVKEEQEEVGTCEDVGSHQLVENQSEQPPEANPAGTTLRKRTNVSKRSSEEEGTMIPLKHDDLERSVVRKDQEVKPVSGKHVTEDASEITKISVIDEDHPDNRGEKGEDEADKQGSDITAIKVKVMGKQRKGNPSKAKVRFMELDMNYKSNMIHFSVYLNCNLYFYTFPFFFFFFIFFFVFWGEEKYKPLQNFFT